MGEDDRGVLALLRRLLTPESATETGAQIGASMIPGVGMAMDGGDIAVGLADRDPVRAGLGVLGLLIPGLTGAQLKAFRRSMSKYGQEAIIDAAARTAGHSKSTVVPMRASDLNDLIGEVPGVTNDAARSVGSQRRIDLIRSESGNLDRFPSIDISNSGDGVARVIGGEGSHRTRFHIEDGDDMIPVIMNTTDKGAGRPTWWEDASTQRKILIEPDDEPWMHRLLGQEAGTEIPFPVPDLRLGRSQRVLDIRAHRMGFDRRPDLTDYHATRQDIDAFDLDHPDKVDSGWLGTGVYTQSDPFIARANKYADVFSDEGMNVMPLVMARGRMRIKDLPQEAKLIVRNVLDREGPEAAEALSRRIRQDMLDSGYQGAMVRFPSGSVETVSYLTSLLRSRNALFDPARKDWSNLMAGVAGLLGTGAIAGAARGSGAELRGGNEDQRR